jgi:hypothetical protein
LTLSRFLNCQPQKAPNRLKSTIQRIFVGFLTL